MFCAILLAWIFQDGIFNRRNNLLNTTTCSIVDTAVTAVTAVTAEGSNGSDLIWSIVEFGLHVL
jgi:hypothetical protein